MDYDHDLRVLKQSFSGGGEGAFYARVLERVRHRPHLDWLDIGVGRDGSTLKCFVERCRSHGQTMAIIGIDPDACAAHWHDGGVQWSLVRSRFQDWAPTLQFDIVNADQSLYYLDDLAFELHRAIAALKPGGLFIATCWSRHDALHAIRERLFPETSSDLVGEDLVDMLRLCPELDDIEVAEFRTEVRIAAWRADPRFLEPAVRVIARGILDAEVACRVRALAGMLPDFPSVAHRINVALCAQRKE
jgi:SAM-dependent methyltransferase